MASPKIGVLVVAYNAETTLEATLNRLPQSFVDRLDHILVADDASADQTYEVGMRVKDTTNLPMTVIKHRQNRGYGGNQKHGYRWAIDNGLDIVVLLHGDGQYAPEVIEQIVAPLESGEADAVFGSRMLERGQALKGGMPLYKFVGNKILTAFQNAMAGTSLSEWHSGYRAYRVDALQDIDFESFTDVFNFDTQIILELNRVQKRIVEVPIPTFYGDEICYVNGLGYAKDVVVDVLRHKLRNAGFSRRHQTSAIESYRLKLSPHSSHGRLLSWLEWEQPLKILDAGCSDGQFGQLVRDKGHTVTGIDIVKHDGVAERLDSFVETDLNSPLPAELHGKFNVVVAADIIEHVADPARLVIDLKATLAESGRIYLSVPNVSHWYPRSRIALGRFDYDERGPLDRTHLRFFTRRTLERLIRECGLQILTREVVGAPIDIIGPEVGLPKVASRWWSLADRQLSRIWPTMFGYQMLYELKAR
uniref:Glycosyltransferase 2-like domain-containing protein n=1 Tax=uncultured bacterium A1Q1_fos_1053 TaxID=1256539 RepID=L7VX01_9BACT|nr:hypothetical protein [uncultured bacterium A1Q1_fos_1053]